MTSLFLFKQTFGQNRKECVCANYVF